MKTSQPASDIDTQNASLAREIPPAEPLGASQAWPSASLLRGQKTVAIEHNGALYRLQSTRAGKLILTK